jgi:ABC-type amino acid transport substrate-binding protein
MPYSLFRCLLRLIFSAAVLALCLGSAASAETLRVALSPDYEPIAFERDGRPVGIEVDNAHEVAKILGRKIKFVQVTQADYIDALNKGRVDVVMSGFSVTPDREAQVAFTAPFMQIGQMAIILSEKATQFGPPRALFGKGVRIVVEPGTTGETYVRANYPAAVVITHPDPDIAFAALRAGEADAYIHDAPTSWLLASTRENRDLLSLYRPLTQENLAWAVRKENVELLAQLNDALVEIRASGRLSAIQNYWIPVTVEVQ